MTNLLVLGGTHFVGRAVAEEGVARGWDVTVLNRGNTPAPEGVRSLLGDRTRPDGLTALAGGTWDVVVDTWTDAPRAVRDSARLLAPSCGHYAYVSSRSVYTWPAPAGADEDTPVVDASPDAEATDYAHNKRGGELAVLDAFGDRALLLRAGLILGPREDVGRLPWWLRRIARGGPVLAPGPRDLPLQYVDARDLAVFALDGATSGLGGAYDTVGRSGDATMGTLLDACVQATGSAAELRWTAPETILAAGIEPWTELPVWAPPGELHDAMHRSDVSRALAAGLRPRPLLDTVADTWATLDAPAHTHPRATTGLSPEKEAEALEKAAS
ncbi:NAD-dependent epimerase/dehydratase family protein [Streptomyces sp. WMMC1477]|uniref:NAD-dependent epimerase/dehydratase family protein n=1 Tax=Streptomyces sp. WMMC1477 TaxID=3015155 RepID=UPI0022B731F3|nr:NAD-dependent epimerase/dehydratase family protein [Streptomyces sp. WMMC1477]MCZ7434239.1 NAD-dependent epimerase/dehydratase family protein [Streptomyces sp. WMMC1477]